MLALDLGMHTGWSLWPRGQRLASGVWHLGDDRHRGRFGELFLRLGSMIQSHRICRVAYEHVHHHTGNDAAHVYGGWLAVLDMLVRPMAIGLVPVTTSELHAVAGVTRATSPRVERTEAEGRKESQRRRKENKAAVVAAAQARGWDVADDNEAEACFIGLAAVMKGGA